MPRTPLDGVTRAPPAARVTPVTLRGPSQRRAAREAARRIVGVVATDFFFDEVDLGPLPTLGVPQQVTLIFNSSDLLVVATGPLLPAVSTVGRVS